MLVEASPQLNSLPQQWLHHLLAHMQREGQSRDDIVRRSAGLPAAFVAVFTAEPTGHPKTLLQHGTPLIDIGSPPQRYTAHEFLIPYSSRPPLTNFLSSFMAFLHLVLFSLVLSASLFGCMEVVTMLR